MYCLASNLYDCLAGYSELHKILEKQVARCLICPG